MPDVISDTTPLQYLFQTGLLDILRRLYGRVIVPEGVARELWAGRDLGLAVPDPRDHGWMHVQKPSRIPPAVEEAGLGNGEMQALALGVELPEVLLLLDDLEARQCAARLGLEFTGTAGVLVKAKRAGYVQAVLPVLDLLESLRFHLDSEIRSEVLRLAEECLGHRCQRRQVCPRVWTGSSKSG